MILTVRSHHVAIGDSTGLRDRRQEEKPIMCLLVFAYGGPDGRFILCNNRDEFFDRETSRGVYDSAAACYSPVDMEAGGTWIAFSSKSNGRFAVILNFHEWRYSAPVNGSATSGLQKRSRGLLPKLFIESPEHISAKMFATECIHGVGYSGYNLIIGDCDGCYYVSNCCPGRVPTYLQPNTVHGITNGRLDDTWMKVLRSKTAIEKIFEEENLVGEHHSARCLAKSLLEVMQDSTPLPDATYGTRISDLMQLSAANVEPMRLKGEMYGTRTITIAIGIPVTSDSDPPSKCREGQMHVFEHDRSALSEWNSQEFSFPFSFHCSYYG